MSEEGSAESRNDLSTCPPVQMDYTLRLPLHPIRVQLPVIGIADYKR